MGIRPHNPYSHIMKTTLDIEDQLLLAAKQRALDTNSTLKQVVETALAEMLKPTLHVATPIDTIVFSSVSQGQEQSTAPIAPHREHDINSKAYWQKRFDFVPPGIK
jgi:hypothetical protein